MVVEAAAPPTEGHVEEKSDPALGGFDKSRFTSPSLGIVAPPAGAEVEKVDEKAAVFE
ncbi:hypothetical protein PC120_g28695 [Phytophthora cactorum]|nr:hypothetical protein PC120_g28695 [Phytophthora cactorum]